MNVFCYPTVFRVGRVYSMLNVKPGATPAFGFRARVPFANGRFDRTEVDVRLSDLLIEAKLTESDFQKAAKAVIRAYGGFSEVFEDEDLPQTARDYGSYQPIRNALAAHAPFGDAGVNASPYFSVAELIKCWPEAPERREISMVSDGIDRYGPGGASDPYVDQAIEQAQRAGIVIFSIYSPGTGHVGHSLWRVNWGQNYLSQISDETGGESFYLGSGPPVSFSPYWTIWDAGCSTSTS
jgi:restriction endonuclease-like protein